MILKQNSASNSKQAVRAYRLLLGFPMEDTFTEPLTVATRNFQREHGLEADGIAGPKTLTARAALKEGALVVASMGPGYWTKGGHFICLWKTTDAYMYANDPASSSRTRQKLAAFEEERKQFFIFYRAA